MRDCETALRVAGAMSAEARKLSVPSVMTMAGPVLRFDLAPDAKPVAGRVTVAADKPYEAGGFGYEPQRRGSAFLFSAAVPEGNYRVTVRVGGRVTVKAESRRLMLRGTLLHSSGERRHGYLPLNGSTPQEIGSALRPVSENWLSAARTALAGRGARPRPAWRMAGPGCELRSFASVANSQSMNTRTIGAARISFRVAT